MREFISSEQIRINAVLGVCARQRELAAENRKLRAEVNRKDNIAGCIGLTIATMFIVASILI